MLSFNTAVFCGPAHFNSARFARRFAHFGDAFKGARFEDVVDFTGAGTHWVAALNGVVFERKVILPRPSEAAANREFQNVILKAVDAAVAADVEEDNSADKDKKTLVETFRLQRLQQIEGGCRALKNALGQDRDEILEQRYYRFQLIARRKQKGVPLMEKAFSWLYALTSNYGGSIGWPIVWLLILIALFGGCYWLADGADLARAFTYRPGDGLDPGFAGALEFSFSRVLPFGAFDDVSKDWLAAFERKRGAWVIGLRILGSIQSTLALALVFVFGLAVRRKFQIA